MANLTRWDPFREMNALRNAMDQMMNEGPWLDRFWNDSSSSSSYGLALDVAENEKEYTVKASVPGVNPDDLDISINDTLCLCVNSLSVCMMKEGKPQHE
ncbi:MAG: hypothetical protein U0175_36485 [Caldilineaceae bacterium]